MLAFAMILIQVSYNAFERHVLPSVCANGVIRVIAPVDFCQEVTPVNITRTGDLQPRLARVVKSALVTNSNIAINIRKSQNAVQALTADVRKSKVARQGSKQVLVPKLEAFDRQIDDAVKGLDIVLSHIEIIVNTWVDLLWPSWHLLMKMCRVQSIFQHQ